MSKSRQELVEHDYEAPREGLETRIAEIVAEVLDVDRVGRSDSFYDFGGTSLQAIRVCVRIENSLGIKVEPLTLVDTDVLADFVAEVGTHAKGAASD